MQVFQGEGVNKYRKGLLGQMMAALSMSILILMYITSTFGVYFSGKNVTVIDREIINVRIRSSQSPRFPKSENQSV